MSYEIKNEFKIIIGISITLILLITTVDIHPPREALGLPFVLFLPGYSLLTVLFPGRDVLDGIERVVLSFGLSITMIPLIGLLLYYTPWGIQLYPIIIFLNLFVLVMSVLGWYRRNELPEEKRLVIKLKISLLQWKEMKKLDRALTVLLVASILFSVGTLAYVVTTPQIGDKFTEFYILGPGGKAEGYPRELKAGQEGSVILGAVNHEFGPEEYRVEIRAKNNSIGEIINIALEHEGKFESPIKFSILEPGQKIKVEFLLYRKTDKVPYRSLYLLVNILNN